MKNPSLPGLYKSLFRHDFWNIGVVERPISAFLDPDIEPEIKWLPQPKPGRYLADPFAIVKDNVLYIMCEEYDYTARKGRIVCIEFTDKSHVSDPAVAMELPVHMSYPYLVEYEGDIYCIPETYRAREIGLYKAQEFPRKWKRLSPIVTDFAGVDPTLFRYEGLWWLTCSNAETGPYDQLFIWYAQDFLGPWTPHSANPVKTALDSSRPAGTPFAHKGNLYRPAQDCSEQYGRRIVVNKITSLTPSQFDETPVAVVEACGRGPYSAGIHTISAVDRITLLDGKSIRFIKDAFKSELARKRNELRQAIGVSL